MSPKLNQALLAERLKLSRATISRSLADHPAISLETRQRVKELAAELGYQLSDARLAARAERLASHGNRPTRGGRADKASGSSREAGLTVGALIGIPDHPTSMTVYSQIVKGLRARAQVERVTLDLCYQPPEELDVGRIRQGAMSQIRNNAWRGALLIHPFPAQTVAALRRRLPLVSILERYAQTELDIIDVDDAPAIAQLVRLLAEAGHSRIGFVSWTYPVAGGWIARRFSGYVEALFSLGLEFRPKWVLNVHQTAAPLAPRAVSDRVAQLLEKDHVSAWVCAADHQAYGLISDLSERGLRVPQDCAVTGFDGLAPPAGLPQVTSMAVPHEQIGAAALTRLVNRIANPLSPYRKTLVDPQPIPGRTI
ncbi:hypothetical protein AXK11_06445 [Cephaloticoccus primus]|uniref:HTH lacI-type domain-containing protein n=1 Tax=Cephaloticoccus primus TaxID=1548207 RepID=A0A139SLJ4_9BACT|nr:LacI family DNA-binding transcriptional regulator [Cephaloticoccus primus]KXU35417.1 hypothetical protein AXK11_06445 [Cephaloticoccus primus]